MSFMRNNSNNTGNVNRAPGEAEVVTPPFRPSFKIPSMFSHLTPATAFRLLKHDAAGSCLCVIRRKRLGESRRRYSGRCGKRREINMKAHLDSPRLMEAPEWTEGFKTG